MKRLLPCLLAIVLVSASSSVETPDGEWLAEQVEQRNVGEDSRLEMEMRLYDHRGRETKRRMIVLSRREAGLDRLFIRFAYPGDMRDTGFLAIENADGEDERFLYLPALGRSRRISAQEKQDSFVGSDLTYEDLSGRRLEDYRFRILGEEKLQGQDTYLLESKAKDETVPYPRSVSWVDQQRFLVLKGEIYDRAGQRAKEFRAERIEEIQGIWTARYMVMKNLRHGTRTELEVTAVSYDSGIPSRTFTRRALEQEGAR